MSTKELLVFVLLLLFPVVVCGQPTELDEVKDTLWTQVKDGGVKVWVTPTGDTAWVHQGNGGKYWRAKVHSSKETNWFYYCPFMQEGYEQLTYTIANLEGLTVVANGLIKEGRTIGIDRKINSRIRCLRNFWVTLNRIN